MIYTKRNYGILPRTINGLMEDVMQNGWSRINEEVNSFTAPVNIVENEKNFNISLMAPGMKKEEFKINVDREILSISYEHKEEHSETENGKTIRSEFQLKSFKRSFTLNDSIDASQISAKYNEGILSVTLPKKEKSTPDVKTIDVN